MAKYSVIGSQAASATAASAGIVKLEAATAGLKKAAIVRWWIGPSGVTPADVNYLIRIARQSTAGTWTAVTPSPYDSTDTATTLVGGSDSTAAGTEGVSLIDQGVNLNLGYMYVCIPGFEYIIPATNANGIFMRFVTVSGGTDVNVGGFEFFD